MPNDWRITRLEHRVHELQAAMVVIVRHLGIEDKVAASERARLDRIRVSGEVPRDRLLEAVPHATRILVICESRHRHVGAPPITSMDTESIL